MTTELQAKFSSLREALNQRHVERYDEVEIALAALLSKFHAVLIGPPGTAKSMLARDLCNAFQGANYFEVLLDKFTTPEALFGPIDIQAMEQGEYKRVTDHTLADCHIAFEDEIFKANSAVLNSQLMAMNERKMRHGKEVVSIPLLSVFGASNELPEGEELGALFDRFQFRKVVNYIEEPSNFVKMLKAPDELEMPTLTLDELATAQKQVRQVEFPDTLYETLYEIRADLQMDAVIVSDRRFRQATTALRAMAWLDGREMVTDDDFRILTHMFWTGPQEYKPVARVILNHTNPLELKAEELIDFADEIAGQLTAALQDAKRSGQDPKQTLTKQGIEWFTRCRQLSEEVKQLETKAKKLGKPMNRIEQAKDRIVRVAREVGRHTIGFEDMDIRR